MRASFLLATAVILGCSACSSPRPRARQPDPESKTRVGLATVFIDGGRYVIDPYTESCFLATYADSALAEVPCDRLKKNLPPAAPYITWVPDVPRPEDEATPAP